MGYGKALYAKCTGTKLFDICRKISESGIWVKMAESLGNYRYVRTLIHHFIGKAVTEQMASFPFSVLTYAYAVIYSIDYASYVKATITVAIFHRRDEATRIIALRSLIMYIVPDAVADKRSQRQYDFHPSFTLGKLD